MILGIGTDILHIDRMERVLSSSSFLKLNFTEKEIALAHERFRQQAYYAKLFAGKEAVFKAFGLPQNYLQHWDCIEILDGSNGEPQVFLHKEIAQAAEARGVSNVHLSLSYETSYAVAFAVLEGDARNGRDARTEGQNPG